MFCIVIHMAMAHIGGPFACLLPTGVLPGSVLDAQLSYFTPIEMYATERVLQVLSAGLEHKPTHTYSLPPTLLFAICDALSHEGVSGHSLLPSVLSKLRPWRLLDQEVRYTPKTLRSLASELADLRREPLLPSYPTEDTVEIPASLPAINVAFPHTVVCDIASEQSTDHGESIPWPSLGDSPCTSIRSLPKRDRPKVSTRSHSNGHRRIPSSEYRSGCAACCRQRDSPSSTPKIPLLPLVEIRSPLPCTQNDTNGLLLRRHTKFSRMSSVPSRKKPSSSSSSLRNVKIDENMLPLPPMRTSNAPPRLHTPSKASSSKSRPPHSSSIGRVPHHSHVLNRSIDIQTLGSVDWRMIRAPPADYQSRMHSFSRTQGQDESKGKCAALSKASTGRRRSFGIVPRLSDNVPGTRSSLGAGRKDAASLTARSASIDVGYLQHCSHKDDNVMHEEL